MMNIAIHSKTIKLTQAIRHFCQEQVGRLFDKGSKISQITFFLEDISRKKSSQNRATAKLKICIPGKNLIVRRQAHDLYQAISETTHRAQRHLRKFKEKRKQHIRIKTPGLHVKAKLRLSKKRRTYPPKIQFAY